MTHYDNDKVFWECGPGWGALIRPLVEKCTELGGRIDVIKEKFGTLVVQYTEADETPESCWDDFNELVQQSEVHSANVCEMCGASGEIMKLGGWYKAICPEHAIELGYKKGKET